MVGGSLLCLRKHVKIYIYKIRSCQIVVPSGYVSDERGIDQCLHIRLCSIISPAPMASLQNRSGELFHIVFNN